MSAPASLLRLDGISLSFRGVAALTDVSFEVAAGEICALIGPNGAGKSSLLNIISGVYRPGRGTITFDGAARRAMQPHDAARSGIARTFQNIALFKRMTVLDNLLAARAPYRRATTLEQAIGWGRARREALAARVRVEELLERLRLQAARDAVVGTLPYGVQKRVELGRALAAGPRLLLLDEPMAGMTSDERRDMARLLADLNADLALTLVLIEHDMGVVMELADHIVVLDHGRRIGDGSPDAIRASSEVIDAYLGVSPPGVRAVGAEPRPAAHGDGR